MISLVTEFLKSHLVLASDAMHDINKSSPLYRPKPKRRLAANNIEVVVTKCLEKVKSGALPDAHNTISLQIQVQS